MVSHFMRILHLTTAALMAAFVIGCSKTPQKPIVSFHGYKVRSDGQIQAEIEVKNPSQFMIACLLDFQGEAALPMLVGVKAGSYTTATMSVTQTNSAILRVTVMRLTPVHQLTVTIP
jgi:hypothetical protein